MKLAVLILSGVLAAAGWASFFFALGAGWAVHFSDVKGCDL